MPRTNTLGRLAAVASAAALALVAVPAAAGSAKGNIVAGAMTSKSHETLVAAVKAAGLVDTLASSGPFTVFAPTDSAFAKLPAGAVESLLQPANREQLRTVLTYHVVPGKVTASDLVQMIRSNGGTARLTTAQGGTLSARLSGANVEIIDAKGGIATVTKADLVQSNGIIHVTDAVSLPQ